nr:MAG TPA: hypothetical protein [Caudoviricetes sp.]
MSFHTEYHSENYLLSYHRCLDCLSYCLVD